MLANTEAGSAVMWLLSKYSMLSCGKFMNTVSGTARRLLKATVLGNVMLGGDNHVHTGW